MSKQSLNVLLISASSRRQGSVSRQLAGEFLSALDAAGVTVNLAERDLADSMPFVDQNWINANFTPSEKRTADQTATLAYSDGLVDELKAADLIIVSTPIYNFNIPAALKAWIDQIARARVTFQYTENGPVGLLENKRAVVVSASGGTEIDSLQDFATGYLRFILSFIGINDVSTIAADKLMIDADAAMAKARADINAAVAGIVSPNEKAA